MSWKRVLLSLRVAIKRGDNDTVRKVCDDSVPNRRQVFKRALKWAVYYNNPDAVTVLLSVTPQDHWANALYHAITHEQVHAVELIMRHIDDSSIVESVVFDACHKNKPGVVHAILTHVQPGMLEEPDIDTTISDCFYYAACDGYLEIVQQLLPYLRKHDFDFTFMQAIVNKQAHVVTFLMPYVSNHALEYLKPK